ncbi:NAD-dependent succinate-semialdehyde dehydrogenase [Pseudomonas aeruginosa]|nr:NAD-dependent succinate-semialdehyde dehydrogenase [uncultured Pseudomonas sp.]EKQ6357996.1 NAD-dependent succinate-semialdehyde dehydrogenase [Pseudomonas aeruginosa]MCT1015630.1 NAD-dependent succinate-semialdehyde dehydrogenase [Pseudomonas aeruginosa]HCF3636071.1 NAD-dependent succinate-semialdehyde dehydrogenase [Pseudomonas aeruginosa]HCF3683691.1 NAD-dependent succinate-semialdehyde dehydrogenase [Pseudomonas aeruginosa]HEJ4442223.1 NAD-dependent succinate-semialdehyde dehydrogenase 
MAYRTLNPYTEETIESFVEHTDPEVEAALAKANALYQSDWSRGDITTRLSVLEKLSTLLTDNRDKLARTMATEMGKPISQGQKEIDLCASITHYYATNARALLQHQPAPSDVGEGWIEFHPIGVLLAVEPWNFPIYQLVRVVAPALAIGNPVMYKHAGIVPRCAALFAELVLQAGAPVGAVTNLYVSAKKVAELLGDPRIQGVALTGSEGAGSKVASRASEMLKKSTLELGGSDVFVVLDDADIAKAVQSGVAARIANAGQVCIGAKRFIVQRDVADQFIEGFVAGMKSVPMGDPLEQDTQLGPLASPEALADLRQQVAEAVSNGARVLTGGKRADRSGLFYEPTVLAGITKDNPAFYQEFFGPVAQVFIVENDDAVVALANDSLFGLGGSIYSTNIDRARRLASRIDTGMVFINTPTTSRPGLPFGGIKRSGYGRELGDSGLKEFANRKLVVVAKS